MCTPRTHDRGRQTILSDVNVFRRHPSPQDVTELQELINANESSLVSLNEEIEACSRQLSALRAKSHAHIFTIRKCKAAMALARLLPPELLAKIFEHACEMGWTRASIAVSHVCSTWRAAAHSHPNVWSRVTINLGIRDPVGWTKHWLSMARQASLHVTLFYTVPTTTLGQVMALLLERSEQWVSLTLELHLADTRQVLAACTTRFTRLRSIRITLMVLDEDIEMGEDAIGFTNVLQYTPSLASVSVVGNVLPRDLPPHLTSLCIEYNDPVGTNVGTPHSVIEALRNLPHLEALTLRLGVTTTPPDILDIELPKLRTLTHEDLGTGEFPILSYLVASSLTRLHACIQPDPEVYDSPTHLIPFLGRSPNLEILEVDGVDIWPAQWLSTLPLLPKLRSLYLHDSDIDDKVIERMFGRSGMCPDLQRIDLRWCQHVKGITLVRLVESRVKDGGCKIEEVAAINCSLVRKQDAIQLASLTTFRIVTNHWDDHCREIAFIFSVYDQTDQLFAGERRCCDNKQYRQRLGFHLLTLPKEERAVIRLVVD